MARILGLGGVFFKCKDPKALADWYKTHLGLNIQDWGGALLDPAEDDGPSRVIVWGPFKADTEYFDPSTRGVMINFRVDDLEAMLARAEAGGGQRVGGITEEFNGRFGWFIDPECDKIELWEPAEVDANQS